MTKPIEDILPKSNNSDLSDALNEISDVLDDFVAFGTHILKWITESNESTVNIPLSLFFRDLIEKADSISILIRKSSIDPAKIILRSIFESHLYIEYLLQEKHKQRANSFLVWELFRKMENSTSYIKGTKQNDRLLKLLVSDSTIADKNILENIPDLSEDITEYKKGLMEPEYKEVVAEFNRTKKKNNRPYAPNWYQLFNGPKTVKQLADHLNLPFVYEILYGSLSGNVHGTDILDGKLVPSKFADQSKEKLPTDIIQIRLPKDAQTTAANTLNFLLKTYITIITTTLSEKQEDYKEWYLSVQKSFRRVISTNKIIKIEY